MHPTLRSLVPLSLLLLHASPARAQVPVSVDASLIAPTPCEPSETCDLPLGAPGQPGRDWKEPIHKWLGTNTADDFAWVEPVLFDDPVSVHGAGTNPNGNLCWPNNPQIQPPPWNLTPAEKLHLEQLWLLETAFYVPFMWFNHDPAIYTLAAMTPGGEGCPVRTPGLAWGDSLAFFADWEYGGNPFRPGLANSDVLKRRLAAWLGLQLIMLDDAHWGGTGCFDQVGFKARFLHPAPGAGPWTDMTNGAELSGQLALMAWTFGHVRSVLDPTVDQAMQTALLTYAERVHLWNPYAPQINRGIRSTYGLYYVYEVTQDPDADAWYQAALAQFFDPNHGNWIPGGYWRDDYGLDLGYGGSCLMAAERALAEDPNIPLFVHTAVETSQDLVAHLALPDVDGRFTAPNAFNSRTSSGPVRGVTTDMRNGYYGGLERYLLGYEQGLPHNAAMLRDANLIGPQAPFHLDPRGFGFHENLACLDAGYTVYVNNALQASPAGGNIDAAGQSDWPNLTRSQDWGPPPTFLEHHRLGLFEDLWDQLQAYPTDALLPVEETGTQVHNFAGRFVYARFDGATEYAATLHLGEVGHLGNGGESGFGGGQLAYLWAPDAGPTLLARRKGRNTGVQQSDDDWTAWHSFPLHTVFVRTAAAGVTTAARITDPVVGVYPLAQPPALVDVPAALAGVGPWAAPTTVPDDQAAALLARASGQIPVDGYNDITGGLHPLLILQQPIAYQRSFLLDDTGVWIETTLGASDPAELVTEVWETIPIWNRDIVAQTALADTQIWLDTGALQLATAGAAQTGVIGVEVVRAGGRTRIDFDHARTVLVSPAWRLGDQESHTLLVDRLPAGCAPGGCALPAETFSYHLEQL